MHRIVIVGGGIAGLSAAWELVAGDGAPVHVTILEGSDRVGGKLRQTSVAGQVLDVGAEAMLAVRPEARELIDEIGASSLVTTPATTAASIWSYGALRPLPPRTLMGVPADPGTARGVLSDAEVERAAAPRPVRVERDISVGDYLAESLGPAVVDRLVEPLLGGVYAGHARLLSLAATVPALYAAAQAGTTPLAAAAALGGKRSAATGSPFIGLVGGVGRLPELLRAALTRRGVEIRTGVTVRELHGPTKALGATARWRLIAGPTIDPEVIEADAVVLALPPAPTRRLLGALAPAAAGVLADIETASMAIVTFAFARAAMPGLSGSGFLVPPIEGRFIKASTFSSAKWGWLDDASPELLFVRTSAGRQGESTQLHLPDDELARRSLDDLTDLIGAPLPNPVETHVQRWGGGLPQYAVGHLDRIALVRNAIGDVPGLEVAGAAYDGVGIPAVIGSGRRAARLIRSELALRDLTHG